MGIAHQLRAPFRLSASLGGQFIIRVDLVIANPSAMIQADSFIVDERGADSVRIIRAFIIEGQRQAGIFCQCPGAGQAKAEQYQQGKDSNPSAFSHGLISSLFGLTGYRMISAKGQCFLCKKRPFLKHGESSILT